MGLSETIGSFFSQCNDDFLSEKSGHHELVFIFSFGIGFSGELLFICFFTGSKRRRTVDFVKNYERNSEF